jgi:O-antigen/teichoic acid export membrane protein
MERTAESATLSCPTMPCDLCTPRSGVAWRIPWGALWVIGSRLAGIGVTFLANIVLARSLTQDEYGKFNLLSSIIALLSLFTMLGLSGAVVRFIPERLAFGQGSQARRILRISYVTIAIVWAVVALTVWSGWPLIATEYFLPKDQSFILLVAASTGLIALLQLTAESLRSFHELRFASLLSGGQTGGLLSNTLFVGLLLGWGLYATASLQDALSLNVISLLVIVPFAMLLLWKTVSNHHSAGEATQTDAANIEAPRMSRILSVCVPILLVQCVTLFSSQADVFIAGACCKEDLGLYSAARRLMLLVAMPLQMANFLVISSIAELKAKKRMAELESLLQTTGILAAIPAMVALAVLILAGGPILELLFGASYRGAALPLAILAVGQFMLTWAGSSHTTLLMTGHQNVALGVNATAAMLLIVCGSLAANYYGMIGLAVVSALIVVVENLALMAFVYKLLGIKTHVPFNWSTWKARLSTFDSLSRLAQGKANPVKLEQVVAEEEQVAHAE